MDDCRRCNHKTSLSQAEIDKMVNEITSIKNICLADDAVYQQRLDICFECDKLEYGCTCMMCGCIVHVRAKLKDGRCPYPKQSKWKGSS